MLKLSSKYKIVDVKRRFNTLSEPFEEIITALPYIRSKRFSNQQLHGKVEVHVSQRELIGLFKLSECVEISLVSVPEV